MFCTQTSMYIYIITTKYKTKCNSLTGDSYSLRNICITGHMYIKKKNNEDKTSLLTSERKGNKLRDMNLG